MGCCSSTRHRWGRYHPSITSIDSSRVGYRVRDLPSTSQWPTYRVIPITLITERVPCCIVCRSCSGMRTLGIPQASTDRTYPSNPQVSQLDRLNPHRMVTPFPSPSPTFTFLFQFYLLHNSAVFSIFSPRSLYSVNFMTALRLLLTNSFKRLLSSSRNFVIFNFKS